jgi:hypothetical protein
MIVLDGMQGEGKTTMAIHIADYLKGAYRRVSADKWEFDASKAVDLSRQYGMGGAKFVEVLQMCVDALLQQAIYDEGGDFNKRGALTEFNRLLNRIFETYRTFRICPIMSLPSASVLDKELFIKGIPRLCLHIENRSETYGNYRAYSLWRMMHVLHKMTKNVVPQQAYRKTYPNFYGQFLDLPPQRRDELRRISDEGKKEILTTNVLKQRGLVSMPDLAKQLNVTRQHLNFIIRKTNVSESNIHKRIRYFDSESVAKITAAMRGKK